MKKITLIFIVMLALAALFMPLLGQAEAVAAQAAQPQASQVNGFERYEGKIHHIFFHSLILEPEKAFASPNRQGYHDWMVTKSEFKAILPKLYQGGFVLINLGDIARLDENGNVVKKPIYLPKGKKPLVISVDDVNYYDYMKNSGFAERLTVDGDGRVTVVVMSKNGAKYDYEGDVIPILDDFVAKHPDFSINGAKGTIAVTGYQGVFGYRTTTLTGFEKFIAESQAELVAERLKASGWTIASHSYSHMKKFRDKSITLAELKADTENWINKIAPIVGRTPVFISPFGCTFPPSDARFKYLLEKGFYIYCPVYKEMTTEFGKNYVINCRLNIDGMTLLTYPERIKKFFFDPSGIIDPSRLKFIGDIN
ncbi:MAG TPA: hypothetical protein P5058_00725 [Eubacteriales bacterium]|nr:hypothetical protein [Eubacteriales bacterium]